MAMLAVTAVGADRPGIIARVAQVLFDHGGNMLDSTMTILGGQFAIVLLVETTAQAAALESDLSSATADLGLVVAVRPVGEGSVSSPPTHMLSVYGADRPGIVAAVTTVLAERAINVTDLTTRVLEGEEPVYAMVLEISLPPDLGEGDLTAALAGAEGLEGVETSISALDVDTF